MALHLAPKVVKIRHRLFTLFILTLWGMAKGVRIGGRQKGTPNKKTQHLQDILDEHGICIPTELIKLRNELDAKEWAGILKDLMSYVYPKRKAIEHTFNPDELDDAELLVKAEEALEHFKAKQAEE